MAARAWARTAIPTSALATALAWVRAASSVVVLALAASALLAACGGGAAGPDAGGCPAGTAASPAGCVDVATCAVDNGGCAQTCLDAPGGRTCACGPGWRLAADGRGCDDVDECAAGTAGCDPAAACENLPGGARCACLPGYAGDGHACADVDECAVDHGGCSPRATCTNTPGARACACADGLCGDGVVCVAASLCGPPAGVAAAPGDGRVTVRWAALDVAATWEVARADAATGPWAAVGTTTSTSFVDATVANGATYWYVVRTLSEAGASPDSPPVAATPVPPPAPPTGLVATSGDGEVALAWTPGAWSTRTRVRRADAAGGPWLDLGTTTGDAFVATGLVDGARYLFVVGAENDVGASADTAPVAAMPLAAPTGLVAVASDRQVALFWDAAAGATRYEVQRAAAPGGPFAAVGASPASRWVDAGLANGVAYAYRVVAVSDVGRGGPSAPVVATPAADATPLPPPEDPTRNLVGLNTWFNRDWDGTGAFVDVFKSGRRWQDGAVWNNPVAGTDARGWPTADASTVLFSGEPRDFNGTYELAFEGQARVSVMWAPGSVTGQTYDPATNTTRARVTFAMTSAGSVGIVLRDTRRTPTSALGTGFANAHLYRPGYPADGSVTFTTPFLAALGRARVVRTMEWVGGGSNVVQRWADRVTPAHAAQTDLPAPPYVAPDGTTYASALGVALEHQLELCNRLMTDCWLIVPPVADDDYVRNMALAVRFGTDGTNPYTSPQAAPVFRPLDPALRVYVEYANENWNSAGGFLSFHLIHAIVAHLAPTHPVMVPTPDSVWTAVWRYPAWRTTTISDIFRGVFGDAAMMTRVRPVLMTQAGNANNTLGAALTWLATDLAARAPARAIADVLWAAGGSGYYGANSMLSALPDVFFAAGNYPDAAAVRGFGLDAVWTRNYGIRHVAYEGGPGLSFSAGDNRALNADPRMKTLMEATHDAWSAQGGDLLVYYNLRGPSEWEFTPDLASATTPKLDALTSLQARPRAPVTLGAALPGTLVARSLTAAAIRSGFGYDYTIDGLPCAAGFAVGQFLAYPGHAATAYAGTLTVRGYAASTTRLAVYVNGAYQGEVTLAGLAGTAHLYDSTPLAVAVPAGLVVVRLEVLSGGFTLYGMTL